MQGEHCLQAFPVHQAKPRCPEELTGVDLMPKAVLLSSTPSVLARVSERVCVCVCVCVCVWVGVGVPHHSITALGVQANRIPERA